ncbi:hypothetical protein [Erwinia sp. ErVv1]|uniref:hypothetical protein n=1 Tax=Erwinia sp. ErVv1 TaxID=1603299 RepID=UPI000830C197|nr:hypothetical protein [Erwinia sp. ErVv1]
MAAMLRRIIKIVTFMIILFIVGRLSAPYFYDIVSIDTADKISNFINDSASVEDIDNVYFYLNFSTTLVLTVLLYLFLSKVFFLIRKQLRFDKKMRP